MRQEVAGNSSYQRPRTSLDLDDDNPDGSIGSGRGLLNDSSLIPPQGNGASRVLRNFVVMSILFSANHGCVVACLGLATARLGSVGAWQSGLLYLTYTGSALFGTTSVVKYLGSRNAIAFGMLLYCFYVGAFWLGTTSPDYARTSALSGACIGGVGAGFIWVAQGSFFAQSAEEHARLLDQPTSVSTTRLASIFAFFYLTMEVGLRSLSSVLLQVGSVGWSTIFALYAVVAILSVIFMSRVRQPSADPVDRDEPHNALSSSTWYKATVAFQMLRQDTKIRYLIGLNAVFGLTSAFLNSYINGEVVQVVFHDDDSKILGLLTAWIPVVAAVMSLVFGRLDWQKGYILSFGAVCFAFVVLPFVLVPDVDGHWNAFMVVTVYTFHGVGRSTFESTLKATFADFFPNEKEGAFANIILQNGLASALGFVLSFALTCNSSRHCVEYNDGSFHNVSIFVTIILVTALLAVWGYWKAHALYHERQSRSVWTLVESDR